MANFHLQVNHHSRANVLGIVAAAAYRAGERLVEKRTELSFDYRSRFGILHTEIMAPPTAPEWVFDRPQLWNTIDSLETRKDARLARDILICLPKELSDLQRLELVRQFVYKSFVSLGMVADFAIHGPSTKKGGCNYHAHVLLTLRTIDRNGFGLKVREWNKIQYLRQWRREWADEANNALEREGFDCRIDHRSRATKEREAAKSLSHLESFPPRRLGFGDSTIDIQSKDESISFINDEEFTAADSDQLPTELIGQEAEYVEILRADSSLDRMQQNQAGLKFLLDLARNTYFSLSERKAELDDFTENFNRRISNINKLTKLHPEQAVRERFILQEKMEYAFFKAHANKILATLLEEEKAEHTPQEIRALFRQSQIEEYNYKKYSNEWHYRAVRDDRYFVFDPQASDRIERIIAVENKKWSELQFKSKMLKWSAVELEKQTKQLQNQLDKNLALSFELTFDRDNYRDR